MYSDSQRQEIKKFANSKSVDTKSPVDGPNNFGGYISGMDGSISIIKNQPSGSLDLSRFYTYNVVSMTNLFSKITSQMINNCIEYILDQKILKSNNDPNFLWEQQPDNLINKFQKCINLFQK